ncbi:DNA topoisomerase 2-binding protein 1-like isoform X1 [Patiria miniata]|uniref:BRCT domain-containing protein n=1 Tax=Patiria miniata TaxID=46514 RepID=A0A914A449_PATMI|nr:DNA topoisomerase 2-binding protein 1-like isoform X1 [Patiria miniata]XP_038058614.1 DNA topoisomerase 2-binding protein 1-like isoform X2 [Patiria miniata]XP_038058615.1 DNA topoisomerase 2-binding protein 1-like isoform X1 [Patiria miniata]
MAGDFCIRMVLTNNCRKEWIKKALEAIKNAGLPTERCVDSVVMNLTKRDSNMYVCDPFEGEAFNHLLELGCRIVGPQCVLWCLENDKAVPKVDHPIYSMSMHNVTISCSNVERSHRDRIHRLVQRMGGTVAKNFTDTVTHLIVGEVGSKKYHVAASLNTPVMLSDWVDKCWERGKERYMCATDEDVMIEFSCPVFSGCVICVTGLESDERRDIRMLADENGGQYTGEMKFNECTHLIVNNPKGPKYEFARKWKIHCVNSKWFFDSVKKGYCQDENLYRVVADVQATSTPIRVGDNPRLSSRPSVANFSAISNVSMVSTVDDTAMTEAAILVSEQHTTMKELDELDLTSANAGLFLDGCKVFLSGFSGVRLEKLRKIINAGGATRFNQINESVSHVVLGDRVPEHVALLTQSTHRPHVVSASWLVDCFKQSCQLPEESYICLDLPPVPSASPATHSKSEKSRKSLASRSSRNKEGTKQSVSMAGEGETMAEDADVMQQYLPGKSDPNETTNDSEIVFKMPQGDDDLTSTRVEAAGEEDETQMEEEPEEEDVTVIEERVDGFFSGKTFVILGFPPDQEEQILEMTVGQGGKVKTAGARCVADIAVVPINGCDVNVDVGEVVSNCWLQMCLEEAQFLDPASNPLFKPIMIMEDASPLSDCVLTVSQYSGVERDCLVHIAELLGARCQEYFSRKAANELRPNTHLLLREANGSKYKAAKKWKVPAVTKDWLLESARQNKRQPENTYLVDLVQDQQNHSKPDDQAVTQRVDQVPQAPDVGRIPRATELEEVPPLKNAPENQPAVHEIQPKEHTVAEVKKDRRTTIRPDANPTQEKQRSLPESKALHSGNKENKHGTVAMDMPRDTPVVNKHLAVSGSGAAVSKDTPSKFLREGAVFHPAFDTKEALEFLESPAGLHPKRRHARKSSLPLDDFFHMNVAKAIQKSGEQATEGEGNDSVFHEQVKSQGILDGLVICVSKKLIAKQRDYNAAAVALGAEFHWTFDDTCTHFIFKGRNNDTSKEFRAARDKGMFIVSPFWLLACEEEERRVDEASYPHTFNPKMSLSVLSTRLETPSRTPARPTRQTRSMARTPHPPPPPTPQPLQDETAMDGFGEGSTDSEDEELLRMVEAAERGEEDGGTVGGGEEEQGSGVNDDQGSMEQKENLQKQLEGIMSSTMNTRGSRRRSRIHKASTSGANASSSNTSGRDRPTSRGSDRRTRSSRAMAHGDEGGQGGTGTTLTVRPPDLHHEASQNVQITWDDPTGRKEREKIMAQLKRSCSPSQNSAEMEDRNVWMNEEVTPDKSRVSIQELGHSPAVSALHREDSREAHPSPTPRAPPIRLPVAKPPVAPQPVEVEQDEPEIEVQTKPRLKFLLSGMRQEEKIDYSALVEQLGGEVKDEMYFDPSCTHLVVGNPTRNEKYLASLASGKWVLHKSFFEACRKAGEFVEEEPHEWGSATDLSTLSEQTVRLALAACRWRHQLQHKQKFTGEDRDFEGAFHGWRVVLYIDRSKESSFKRILLAGGAKVMGMRPPFSNLHDVTHAFMDLQKTKTPEGVLDLEAIASAGILCLRPEYIADFLMHDPVPDHTNYFINEIKPIMESISGNHHHTRSSRTPSKRKRHDAAQTPKSKKGRVR